jgi:cyanate permease
MNTVGQVASAISGYVYGALFDVTGNFQMIWAGCLTAFVIRIFFCLGNLEEKEVTTVVGNGEQVPT